MFGEDGIGQRIAAGILNQRDDHMVEPGEWLYLSMAVTAAVFRVHGYQLVAFRLSLTDGVEHGIKRRASGNPAKNILQRGHTIHPRADFGAPDLIGENPRAAPIGQQRGMRKLMKNFLI